MTKQGQFFKPIWNQHDISTFKTLFWKDFSFMWTLFLIDPQIIPYSSSIIISYVQTRWMKSLTAVMGSVKNLAILD